MPKYQVIITAPAFADMQGIVDHITFELREPVTAQRQLDRIQDAIFSLEEFPMRHALVADYALANKGYRMLTIDNYIVLYVVSKFEETVTVIRVFYNRRDWLSLL